ncbi:MAG: succinyl-diaminopimelate desuccinylase [Parcubacteria group bacterium Gr01-1014_70]|nr:MAG: succinyl-diaminopimelate desuccinylase [Parcubacteria group bacterium Gr01-1014_70]
MLSTILKQLVSIRTVSHDNSANKRLLDVAANTFEKFLFIKQFSSNSYPSLVATSRRMKKPKLLLVAHTDVITGSEKLFTVKAHAGKLFGRGVLDMKFALACYIQLMNELGADVRMLDVGIMLTSDEEIGGFNGVEFLLQKGYGADFVCMPDGGMNWQIERGSKGMWHVDFDVRGKAAHAAHPWEGESAIITFFRFLQDLEKEFRPRVPCDGTHYHDTLTVSRIEGGDTMNQVPARLAASVNIRYVPETSKTELVRRIQRALKKYPQVSFKERVHGHAWITDTSHPHIKKFVSVAKQHGISVGETFSHGSSDARFFTERGIPVLTIWPRGGGHHGDEEWIGVRDFEVYYRILKDWVLAVAKR